MSDPDSHTSPGANYVLGHSDSELGRLATQARLIDPITRRFFTDAGIVPGMRVLDVGSGAGDVAFLAANLVGETGEVVGVDRAAAALAVARARADAQSLHNVSFREGELAETAFDRPFDAVIGRYVLMFQPDPAALLRKLGAHVRPGGCVVFHEVDWDGARSFPPTRIYDTCCRWLSETMRLSGAEPHMGVKLHATFLAAGLPAPLMRLGTLIGGGGSATDALELVAGLTGTLRADMERFGIATAAEIGYETLARRMIDEAAANGSVIVGRSEIGAWSTV